MKRIYSILTGIMSLFLLTAFMGYSQRSTDTKNETEQPEGEIFVSYGEVKIYPWEKDGDLYFFLPSSFEWEQAELTVLNAELQLNGESVDSSIGGQNYASDTIYDYRFYWGETEKKGSLQFMKSENTGAVYIETESGSMEQIDGDKEYQESGLILVEDSAGDTCYRGLLRSMKSRGNSTWQSEKKSYTIKLWKAADLFHMGEGKNWILVSNVFDGSKLQNKICLDMASDLGLPYTSQGEYVELYLNGRYQGNYLLCEKIEINENRVAITNLEKETEKLNGDLSELERFDTSRTKGISAEYNPDNISGGYIIEKDHYTDSISGFMTEEENLFSIKEPQYATQEQVDYIMEYIQQIEDMLLSNDEELFDYIDLDSFVLRYLLDEVVLNHDFGITSMYFYKEQGDQKLYAGPIWDYDGSMGRGLTNSEILAALEIQNYRREKSITWYPYLYQNDTFYKEAVKIYQEKVRPYILSLLEEDEGKIDVYARMLESSMSMDMTRWSYSDCMAGYYEEFENNVRYIKFYLARRLQFLDEIWLGEDNHYEPEGNGERHTATFIGKKKTESFEVSDGEVIIMTPEHLLGEQEWWYNVRDERLFVVEIPVYEDITYYARRGDE
ncbi:MAG: hypothetical protein HFI20_07565 [Lachnospiraceae bacterium]|nr:hypothetical protein [Lachnospiraceae bacterium]MCI9018662.1 hypothetical protein [Lachnospiraceae bacterium]